MKIGIFGYGRIGRAVHQLISVREGHNLEVEWYWDISDPGAFFHFDPVDVVVNAAPYTAINDARTVARRLGAGYIDFTEDTSFWLEKENLSLWGKPIVPHCGIAPGVINIIGAEAINHTLSEAKALGYRLYCGALPERNPGAPLYHEVTWNAAGMSREYVGPSERIVGGHYLDNWPLVRSPASVTVDLSGRGEKHHFEAASTSGGIGTMARTYKDKVGGLVYRTLRWPGHWKAIGPWLKHPEVIAGMLATGKATMKDMVVIKVTIGAGLTFYEAVIRPDYGLSAIELATASGGCAVLDLLDKGYIGGGRIIRQEEIDTQTLRRSVFSSVYPVLP